MSINYEREVVVVFEIIGMLTVLIIGAILWDSLTKTKLGNPSPSIDIQDLTNPPHDKLTIDMTSSFNIILPNIESTLLNNLNDHANLSSSQIKLIFQDYQFLNRFVKVYCADVFNLGWMIAHEENHLNRQSIINNMGKTYRKTLGDLLKVLEEKFQNEKVIDVFHDTALACFEYAYADMNALKQNSTHQNQTRSIRPAEKPEILSFENDLNISAPGYEGVDNVDGVGRVYFYNTNPFISGGILYEITKKPDGKMLLEQITIKTETQDKVFVLTKNGEHSQELLQEVGDFVNKHALHISVNLKFLQQTIYNINRYNKYRKLVKRY